MGFGPGTTLASSFELETVVGTVERFPIVPPRPAMNPSAMAAAVARHQVTKQTKTNNCASTAQTLFTAGSLLLESFFKETLILAFEANVLPKWNFSRILAHCEILEG